MTWHAAAGVILGAAVVLLIQNVGGGEVRDDAQAACVLLLPPQAEVLEDMRAQEPVDLDGADMAKLQASPHLAIILEQAGVVDEGTASDLDFALSSQALDDVAEGLGVLEAACNSI